MTKYVYGTMEMEDFALKPEADLQLPRYQRPKGKWAVKQQFELALSVAFDMPAGYICLKEGGSEKMLIDGRQRREAILKMLDPLSFATIISTAIPSEVTLPSTSTKSKDIDKRIYEFARDWLKSYDEENFLKHYKDSNIYDLQALVDLCDDRGIGYNASEAKSKKKLAVKLATDDMETGLNLDKKYQDCLQPYVDLMNALTTNNTVSLRRGFNGIYRADTVAHKKCWGIDDSTGPKSGIDHPSFFNYLQYKKRDGSIGSKWKFDPGEFSLYLRKFFKLQDWNNKDCLDMNKMLQFFIGEFDSIKDKKALLKFYEEPTKVVLHERVFLTFKKVRDMVSGTNLGTCKLTKECTVTEAMKVFQLINDAGVQLSEIEILASWPDWGYSWVYDLTNPCTDPDLKDAVKSMYEDAKSMPGVDLDRISKWDIAATTLDRLDHQLIWGD